MANLAVIEISADIIKVIQARLDQKGIFITKIITHSIAGLPQEAIASSLGQIISQNAIKAEKIIGVISRKDITMRMLKLPSAESQELQKMISFEAIKQIPFPAEDIFFDYRMMEATDDGYSHVVLSIAHKNIINNFLKLLDENALKPDILTPTSEGLYLWARFSLAEDINDRKNILIIDMDRDKTELQILSGKKILLSRTSVFGAASLLPTNAEQQTYNERLLLEVKRSISAYAKGQKQELPIDKIVLTGCSEAARATSDMFKENLNVPVLIIESTNAFKVHDRAFVKEFTPEGVSICSALGALFALTEESINMLPPEIKKKQVILEKSKKAVVLAALGVCIFLMASAAGGIKFYQKTRLLNIIKSSIKEISPATKTLETKFKRLELVQSHIKDCKKSLAFLYELHNVIPEGVLLNYLSFDKEGTIILQGTTSQMSDVFNFVGRLEKSKKFKNIETNYVSKRRLKDRETVDFQITCKLI